MTFRRSLVLLGIVTIFLAGITALVFWRASQESKDKPVVVESVKRVPNEQPENYGPHTLVGESIRSKPDTDLVNQHADTFAFESLPNQPTVLSFIFTRCPDSSMCPLITKKMKHLKNRYVSKHSEPAQLVSVTMDPEYDTPAILRDHADQRDLDLEGWSFVTGPVRTISALEDSLKVDVLRENSQVRTHNMRTFFIDEQGVIRDVFTGSDWSVKDALKKLDEIRET